MYTYRFTMVFKDLVNGVPTAYQDLESLLTNSEDQIQKSYEHLPSFLQKLIKQLPAKMTQSVGPEVLAAAAERQGLHSKYTDHAAHAAEKMGVKVRVPNLKDLVTKPGAVAGMLYVNLGVFHAVLSPEFQVMFSEKKKKVKLPRNFMLTTKTP